MKKIILTLILFLSIANPVFATTVNITADANTRFENWGGTGTPTWATARGATDATGQVTTTGSGNVQSADRSGTNLTNGRGFYMFDTSSIPAGAVITSATLNVRVDDGVQLNVLPHAVIQSTQATWNNVGTADYDQCGSVDGPTEGATRATPGGSATWTTWTFNATGLSWIAKSGQTKPASASASGKTQICLRNSYDVDNTDPGERHYVTFSMMDEPSDQQPYLSVTYSMGSFAFWQFLDF